MLVFLQGTRRRLENDETFFLVFSIKTEQDFHETEQFIMSFLA